MVVKVKNFGSKNYTLTAKSAFESDTKYSIVIFIVRDCQQNVIFLLAKRKTSANFMNARVFDILYTFHSKSYFKYSQA